GSGRHFGGELVAGGQVPEVGAIPHSHGQQPPVLVDGAGVIIPLTQGWVADQGAVLAAGSNFPQPDHVPVYVCGQQTVIRTKLEGSSPPRGAEKLLAGARIP